MPSSASDREAKALLRAQAKQIRDAIPAPERAAMSLAIVRNIRALPTYKNARIVALFMPIRSEVDLRKLTEDKDKRFVYPRVVDNLHARIEFAFADTGFQPGPFGLTEPSGSRVEPDRIDLILAPGLAFSPNGARIGYGKGFYDHYLSHYRHVTVGVCFARQIVPEIPSGAEDVAMDMIVTEKGSLCIKP